MRVCDHERETVSGRFDLYDTCVITCTIEVKGIYMRDHASAAGAYCNNNFPQCSQPNIYTLVLVD